MKDFKEIWREIPFSWKLAFFICMTTTIGLLIGGFITPPPGQIDDSIFKGCFIVSIYPTLFTAFICVLRGMHVNYDIKGGKLTVTTKKRKAATTSKSTNKKDETVSKENKEN